MRKTRTVKPERCQDEVAVRQLWLVMVLILAVPLWERLLNFYRWIGKQTRRLMG